MVAAAAAAVCVLAWVSLCLCVSVRLWAEKGVRERRDDFISLGKFCLF